MLKKWKGLFFNQYIFGHNKKKILQDIIHKDILSKENLCKDKVL